MPTDGGWTEPAPPPRSFPEWGLSAFRRIRMSTETGKRLLPHPGSAHLARAHLAHDLPNLGGRILSSLHYYKINYTLYRKQ